VSFFTSRPRASVVRRILENSWWSVMIVSDDSPLKLEPFERGDGGGNSLEA